MKSKDRKICLETQGQNTIVIKASHYIHGTRVMRRFTQVARSIVRQKWSRQLLDPVSLACAATRDVVLERIRGPRHRRLVDKREMPIAQQDRRIRFKTMQSALSRMSDTRVRQQAA